MAHSRDSLVQARFWYFPQPRALNNTWGMRGSPLSVQTCMTLIILGMPCSKGVTQHKQMEKHYIKKNSLWYLTNIC
jgi:hypothetical protein